MLHLRQELGVVLVGLSPLDFDAVLVEVVCQSGLVRLGLQLGSPLSLSLAHSFANRLAVIHATCWLEGGKSLARHRAIASRMKTGHDEIGFALRAEKTAEE